MNAYIDYEVDYVGNIIELLPIPRTSYPPIPTQSLDSLSLDDINDDLEHFDFCICDYCMGNGKPGCVLQGMIAIHGGEKPKYYCKMFYHHEINEDGQEVTYYMG